MHFKHVSDTPDKYEGADDVEGDDDDDCCWAMSESELV